MSRADQLVLKPVHARGRANELRGRWGWSVLVHWFARGRANELGGRWGWSVVGPLVLKPVGWRGGSLSSGKNDSKLDADKPHICSNPGFRISFPVALESGRNSAGRVSASQAECRGFDSRRPLQLPTRSCQRWPLAPQNRQCPLAQEHPGFNQRLTNPA